MTDRASIPLMGRLSDPDGEAVRRDHEGGLANVQVRIRRGKVTDAVFFVQGCSVTMACLSAACALARGKEPAEIRSTVTPQRIDEVLGGLPPDHERCAKLAIATLVGAIDDAILNGVEDWQKLYRVRRR